MQDVQFLTIYIVLLWLHYYGALIRLYEPIIYMPPSFSANDPTGDTHRTEGLWSCLKSANDFLTSFLAIPVDKLGSLPFVVIAHLSFAIVTCSRLLFLEDSDWDVKLARRSLNLVGIVARLEETFQAAEVSQTSQGTSRKMKRKRKFVDDNESMLSRYAERMRWIRHWYNSMVPVEGHGAAGGSVPNPANEVIDTDAGGFMEPVGDYGSAFWQALLNLDGPWDSSDPRVVEA
jgi:hypothetical protein